MLSKLWNRFDRRFKDRFMYVVGIIVIIFFCVFAKRIWPELCGKPDMILNGEAEITIQAGEEFQDPGATATILDKSVSDRIYVTGTVDVNTPGTYDLEYNVDGRWMTYCLQRTVTVEDHVAPDIVLKGDDVIIVDKLDEYTEQGAKAIDNCDGDVTSDMTMTKAEPNDYMVTYTYEVTDSSGNTATKVREVRIPDHKGPEIELAGDAEMETKEREVFDDPGVKAIDERDGDLSETAVRTGFIDIYKPGTYTVTYTVTDREGNEASITRDVTVNQVYENPKNAVYLTFDDGPSPDVTVQILDTLKRNNVKATFFICDYDEKTLPVLKRMIEEGHTVAIHGYSHDYGTIYASTEAFMNNINKLKDKLEADTGYKAFAIRFPGGSGNGISKEYCPGIMTELVQQVTDAGLMYVDWNTSSHDAESTSRDADEIVSYVADELSSKHSNIVLMHDTSAKQSTADALQGVIDYCKNNGFELKPIEEDTVPIHQTLIN